MWNVRAVETRVVRATKEQLESFTRKELRLYAESRGIERGRSKSDTIANIMATKHATILIQLGD